MLAYTYGNDDSEDVDEGEKAEIENESVHEVGSA